MNDKDARTLATQVAKTSNGVSIKVGRTNGQSVLHLRNNLARQSETIRSVGEWLDHRWNKQNAQPKAQAA